MKLLERVREYLHQRAPLAVDKSGAPADLETRTATAVLLLEAAYGDEEYAWREHRVILNGLAREFGIGRREALDLLELAEGSRPPFVKLADIERVVREHYDEAQREEVVELLWKVIAADRVIEEWEEAFGNHVASAMDVSPERAKDARERARAL